MNTEETLKTLDFTVYRRHARKRNIRIIRDVLNGATSEEVAKKYDLSVEGVHYICRIIGIKLVEVHKSIRQKAVESILQKAGENPTWMDAKRIADEEGMNETSIRRILIKNGISVQPRPSPKANSTLRVENCFLKGLSEEEIVRITEVSLSRVRGIRKKMQQAQDRLSLQKQG